MDQQSEDKQSDVAPTRVRDGATNDHCLSNVLF
jgi:hypothetical protein